MCSQLGAAALWGRQRRLQPRLAGAVPSLRAEEAGVCVREATCKLFITCLNYWVNIDWRLRCPRSYLWLPRAHPWCSGIDVSGWGSGWATQRARVPLRMQWQDPPVESRALPTSMSVCGRSPGGEVGLNFAHLSFESVGRISNLSKSQSQSVQR